MVKIFYIGDQFLCFFAAVNRDKSDDPELSLAQGVGELQVEHSLHAAFMQVSAIPSDSNELVLPASSHEKGGSVQQDVGGASWPATSQRTQQQGERTYL